MLNAPGKYKVYAEGLSEVSQLSLTFPSALLEGTSVEISFTKRNTYGIPYFLLKISV